VIVSLILEMTAVLMLGTGASALLLNAPLRPHCARGSLSAIRMSDDPAVTDYEAYIRARDSGAVAGGTMESAQEGLIEFNKYDMDFDGGDSGGGVVGDGECDLEDQHNSASLVRGGFGGAEGGGGEGSLNVGRGTVKSATESRTASAGKNYFGRSTGYADKKISEMTDEQVYKGQMDCVRAQQLENWHNQRAISKQNRAQGQGVVFGEKPRPGGSYQAREALSSEAWRTGSQEGVELNQRQLAKHLDDLRNKPAARLDGKEWEELQVSDIEEVEETFHVKTAVRGVSIETIMVKNMFNTYAPYQCGFTPDSPPEFSVSPTEGSMNRRSGDPIEVTVRYNPKAPTEGMVGTLVFETEDFKKVYKFIGST